MKSLFVHFLMLFVSLLLFVIEKVSGANNRVNIACPTVYKGVQYLGVSLRPGVHIGTETMPCVAGKTRLTLKKANGVKTKKQPNVFIENASSVEEGILIPIGYLDIKA
jgi:hypothetical protein